MKSSAYLKWLKQWIDGSLTARDEQQLEQATREDAFLRDALEGLQSAPEEDHEKRLARLRKKIQQPEAKQRRGRIIPLALRRIAATLLLVIGLGTIWWLNQTPDNQGISMEEVRPPTQTEAAAEPEAETGQQELTEALPEPPTEEPAAVEEKSAPPPAPEPTTRDYELDEVLTDEGIAEEAPPAITAAPRMVQPRTSPALPQASEAFPLESLQGQIIDMEGRPVAGAVILNQSGEQEAISDAAGNFKLSALASAPDSTYTVQHFNYQDTSLRLKDSPAEPLVVAMQRESPSQLRKTYKRSKVSQPVPVGGFDYFRSDNQAYRAFFTNSRLKRNPITIAFTVYPFGEIGNFEVLSLASDTQIEQVSEFLQNGPQWILPSGVDSLRTQITIPVQE
ncbi:MAG TPA: carboxypeptidase-like regulatory domain-containing protein [Saprospiraceae bacterium]|nr:carboxypeptidase-like regulatory domain-containing protein [Saprospiraceae bacterium]